MGSSHPSHPWFDLGALPSSVYVEVYNALRQDVTSLDDRNQDVCVFLSTFYTLCHL